MYGLLHVSAEVNSKDWRSNNEGKISHLEKNMTEHCGEDRGSGFSYNWRR